MTASLLLTLLLAHPVPRDHHDRTIVIHLQPQADRKVLVTVKYRLEVDETTVILDLRPFADEIDLSKVEDKRRAMHDFFVQKYGPILAKNLTATLNGQPLAFTCKSRSHRLNDEKGQALGHLRCDFEFRALFTMTAVQQAEFTFREDNYVLQPGLINLSLSLSGTSAVELSEPSEELKQRPLTEWKPGDEERLRRASATFMWTNDVATVPAVAPVPPTNKRPEQTHDGLLALFNSGYGLWLMLLLAAGFGAAHALTPGHGKTLVAAYLVGERGTVWHAVFLGIVTTVTHTSVVLVIALALYFVPEGMSASSRQAIQTGLGLAMGLLVACMGVWLLLQRLSGKADHVHIGGGHHHHHGGHQEATLAGGSRLNETRVGWWRLVVLGMTGGIVPCWDAIFLLLWAVITNQFWLGLPLTLAFSVGLAGVLVAVGILVVKVRQFAGSHWGEGRIVKALPIVSAVLITVMGLWLCYDSIHSSAPGH